MLGLGVAELNDCRPDRGLARSQAETGGTRFQDRADDRAAFHGIVEWPAPGARPVGVIAPARLEGQIDERVVLVGEAPVYAIREQIAVPSVGLPPTGVHAESGVFFSTRLITPAIASDPYWAEAPSLSTSMRSIAPMGMAFISVPARAAPDRVENMQQGAIVPPLAVDQHQNLVRAQAAERGGAH